MAEFSQCFITNEGFNLLAKALKGQKLEFTKCVAGSGFLPEGQKITELTDLIEPRRDMGIERMYIPGKVGTVIVTASFSNEGLIEGFLLREIGLFAKDPDTEKEILYSYCNAGNFPDPIPAQDSPSPVFYRFNLTTFIEQAPNVSAVYVENPLHVTYVEMQESIDKTILYLREKIDSLQEQINILSGISIENSRKELDKIAEEVI